MTLEQQVTSLEISKKLKELGVKQESLFFWSDWLKKNEYSVGQNTVVKVRTTEIDGSVTTRTPNKISAFTVAELGEMLPWRFGFEGEEYYYSTGKDSKDNEYYKEHEIYYEGPEEYIKCLERADTEADARGKMLVYLLENKLI